MCDNDDPSTYPGPPTTLSHEGGCVQHAIFLCCGAQGDWRKHFEYYKCLDRVLDANPHNLTVCTPRGSVLY